MQSDGVLLFIETIFYAWVLNEKHKEKKVNTKTYKSKYKATEAEPTTPQSVLEKYRPLLKDDSNILSNALKGIKISAVVDFAYISGKDRKEIAGLINTSYKTLQFSTLRQKLPPLQGELLLKFFALYDKGLSVFGEAESFNSWLKAPAFGLDHEVPEKLLLTFTSINKVMDELVRIEYGNLA